jgi:nitroreductase
MTSALSDVSLDQIFRSARTFSPVKDATVREIHDLMKWGPTSANSSPARCPMSGFDNAGVDEAFFSGTRIKSNIIRGIGYGDPASVFPRNPRLSLEEAGRWAGCEVDRMRSDPRKMEKMQ